MPQYFLGKRMVVFTAHPDDEQLAAGTMYENYKAHGETYLICATSGEKGKSYLAKPVSDKALARIREKELLAAAKILHIKKVIFLHLPDGKVRENEKKLFKLSSPIIQKIKPEQILTFGPDGISAHWDHIICGKVGHAIAKKMKIPVADFTLFHMMAFTKFLPKKFLLSRRKFGVYAGIPKYRKPNVTIKVDPLVKRRAMALHKSQFGATGGTPVGKLPVFLQNKIFGREYFVGEKLKNDV